jgi:hypothetical protein
MLCSDTQIFFRDLQLPEDVYGKKFMFMSGMNISVMAMQVSLAICTVGKVMLEVFFDAEGLAHHEFILEQQTVNKGIYIIIPHHIRDTVRRKQPEKLAQNI